MFYPNAMASVENLRRDGYAVAICTNKPEYLARLLMTRMGALEHFDALIGADSLRMRKPDPETAVGNRAAGRG